VSGWVALFERSRAEVDARRVERMAATLDRRGPDGVATHLVDHVGLVQASLAATAEDEAALLSRRGRGEGSRGEGSVAWHDAAACGVVADALLFERASLAERLGVGGVHHATSDAELILRAFVAWGEDCVHALAGEWSFAAWDARSGRLFVARDPLGLRPAYYSADHGTVRCASDVAAVLADDRVPAHPDRRAMAAFVVGAYAEVDETLWRGVRAVPPGAARWFTSTATGGARHYVPRAGGPEDGASLATQGERLREALERSVRERVRARGRVLVEVSGGLDSGAVAALARRNAAEGDVELVTLSHPGREDDETVWARRVADAVSLPLLEVAPADFEPWARPDPARLSANAYYHPTVETHGAIFELGRQRGARVVLSGLGGDELFGGAPLDSGGSRARLRSFARRVVPSDWRRLARRLRRGRRCFPDLEPDVAEELYEWLVDQPEPFADVRPAARRRLCETMMTDASSRLPLVRVERRASFHGAEMRHPFWDRGVMELALTLPLERRVGSEGDKPVLRSALRGLLPKIIVDRPKDTSFTGYVSETLRERHRDVVEPLLSQSHLERRGVLRAGAARGLLNAGAPLDRLVATVALELLLRSPIG
jgi:asparagine synthase (glutamine-hydrolysing)